MFPTSPLASPPVTWIGLALLGVAVGGIGTLIGAGGGFILMPVLLLLYPREQTSTLASISLGVVCFNALSGSIGYARLKQIDYRSGILFSIAGVPGAIIGAMLVPHIHRSLFDTLLGVVLLGAGLFMAFVGALRPKSGPAAEAPATPRRRVLGVIIAFFVGVLSSLLGIGGGIIHVPLMVYALGFPVHMATATSHFVLAMTSGAGTAAHILTGALEIGWHRMLAIGLGAVVGAQIGAHFSPRVHSTWIIRGLGIALALAGARLLYGVLTR